MALLLPENDLVNCAVQLRASRSIASLPINCVLPGNYLVHCTVGAAGTKSKAGSLRHWPGERSSQDGSSEDRSSGQAAVER